MDPSRLQATQRDRRLLVVKRMPKISADIWSEQDLHHARDWIEDQCYRFYVRQRRSRCLPDQLMDLWLVGPLCEQCLINDPIESMRVPALPDVSPANWKWDLIWKLGELGQSIVERTEADVENDPDFAFRCSKCRCALRPWAEDSICIYSDHLEEKYSIATETPGKTHPSKEIRNLVFRLYEGQCFACQKRKADHIDQIRPRSRGGDSAFRNLQPLCGECGQRKADNEPEEVIVHYDLWFRDPPSDAYEGLFW